LLKIENIKPIQTHIKMKYFTICLLIIIIVGLKVRIYEDALILEKLDDNCKRQVNYDNRQIKDCERLLAIYEKRINGMKTNIDNNLPRAIRLTLIKYHYRANDIAEIINEITTKSF